MKYALPLALALATLAFHASANAASDNIDAGREAFTRLCASCHHVGPSARGAFGPQLNGLFGRRAGSTADYRYSDAMKASNVVWSDATLSAFVQSPGKLVPGTKMRFWGMSDPRQIEDLLAYLRTYQ
ncbi:MAG: c-type cytochrome [Dyella sp.]|nr:c-type cytochrome [Dyella sp.]